MSKRINVYIRDMTSDLLDNYCEINELDRSRAVDELLFNRLSYLEQAKAKAFKTKYDACYKFSTRKEERVFEKWCKETSHDPYNSKTYIDWLYAPENPDYQKNYGDKNKEEI